MSRRFFGQERVIRKQGDKIFAVLEFVRQQQYLSFWHFRFEFHKIKKISDPFETRRMA